MAEPWNYERTALLELMREHESIRRDYKIRLKPITVVLFDSESRWGQYDPALKTISLARRLVNEQPWDFVLGVFRHEIAHQLVDEEGGSGAEGPHGPRFKDACRRLGVSAQYARAGLDLSSTPLDWRLEPQDPAVERILDRVKKLMALAGSLNEHEAVLAMSRVRELYAKYNLEQMHRLKETEFVHLVINEGKKRTPSWQNAVLSVLAEHFFVRVLSFSQYRVASGDRTQAVEIIGTRENVLMAEYVYHFLRRQVEELLNRALEVRPQSRRERTSFKLGVLHGFASKLKAGERTPVSAEIRAHGSVPTVIGSALAKFRQRADVDRYMEQIYPRLSTSRRGSVTIESSAYHAGRDAGHQINLNKPITHAGGAKGHFLSSSSSKRNS